jgi:hypothetical protein
MFHVLNQPFAVVFRTHGTLGTAEHQTVVLRSTDRGPGTLLGLTRERPSGTPTVKLPNWNLAGLVW